MDYLLLIIYIVEEDKFEQLMSMHFTNQELFYKAKKI